LISILVPDRRIRVRQRCVERDLLGEQIRRGIIPTFPCISRQGAQLVTEGRQNERVHIDRYAERHCDFLPYQFDDGRTWREIVELIRERFMHVGDMWPYVDAERVF